MSDEMAIDENSPTEYENAENADKVCNPKVIPEQKPEPKTEDSSQAELEESSTPEELVKDTDAHTQNSSATNNCIGSIKIETEIMQDVPNSYESDDSEDGRGVKRRASMAFSDDGDEGFKGFDNDETTFIPDLNHIVETVERNVRRKSTSSEVGEEFKGFEDIDQSNLRGYNEALERLEAELTEAAKDFRPLKTVMAVPTTITAGKRPRQDTATDGSRPSSALSSRSEGDMAALTDASMSPAARGRRPTTEMWSPLLRVPLESGWRREVVYRAAHDAHSRRNADIYYYTPAGKKLRSMREVAETLSGTGLSTENFSFFKEPMGVDDPEKEIIRDAKVIGGARRVESPVPSATAVEGKRTPKPKAPKGVSPEPAVIKSPPAKLKVKLLGARLNNAATPKQIRKPQAPPAPAAPPASTLDNNNTAAWKKPSDKPGLKGRLANGAALSPRRRGRPRLEEREVDHFSAFCRTASSRNYDVATQIFQYLGMRELARSARVCKQWREMAHAPALWRHVRMKNSHVSDWGGLCKLLKKHGTKWLDLRKMLLPQNDTTFWDQFTEHIGSVDTLERLELCRCPARAVEAACGVAGLRVLAAPAIHDAKLDPAPLARLPRLELLRLKSLAGLSLSRDLRPLAELRALQHLSLTSIKELGWCACEVVGQLDRLESLELGECSFDGGFAPALTQLKRLRRLRLERGVPHCAAPALLRALAAMPALTTLELVNFDIKVGFDDALAECKNIQKLLIIPTYVSQSATTNKQVLSGVLRLKETLTHLMWGVTIELLRVTELFIDQCEAGGTDEPKRRDVGECIPVLKPVPGCRLPDDHRTVAGPPQVEILPIPTLQRLLSAQLPHTKLKLLRIPFHATWRQSLADFQ